MRSARILAATACVAALLVPLPSSAATKTVEIPGRYFNPQHATITVGGTVSWTNSSSDRHTITAMSSSKDRFSSSDNCPGSFLFNDCVRPGGTYEHTFSRAGVYDYYCVIHGNEGTYPDCAMCGRVTVKKKGGAIVPTPPGSLSPTSTASSPSASPTTSGSPSPTPNLTTPVAAGPGDGTSSSTLVAIAAVAVALLGGTGVVVYRTMIRRA